MKNLLIYMVRNFDTWIKIKKLKPEITFQTLSVGPEGLIDTVGN